jgi:hypothetical protein
MLRTFVLLAILVKLSTSDVFGNSTIKTSYPLTSDSMIVALNADNNAFMCPFLSPLFMEKLRQNKAIGVFKNTDLIIRFSIAKLDFTEELIFKLAENVGYMRNLIHIETQEK